MADKRVMVVDDEDNIRELYRRVLTGEGYDVAVAASAEEALALMKEAKCEVAFLDLNMPDRNGIELCRELKEHHPIMILYAMTGYTSLFELADCREAGFEDYFTKPVPLGDLRQAVKIAFEKIDRWKTRQS